MTEPSCPCGSGLPLASCCAPLHQGMPASSSEALMRSRYSAYVLGNIDYLVASTLPAQQTGLDRDSMQSWMFATCVVSTRPPVQIPQVSGLQS